MEHEPHPDDIERGKPTWSVIRMGDDGNEVLVRSGLTKTEAGSLAKELESHGHKQLYWITSQALS